MSSEKNLMKKNLILNKLQSQKSYKFLFFFLIIISNISLILSSHLPLNLDEIDIGNKAEYPYVDSGCNLSKLEFMYHINKTNELYGTQTDVIFYSNPSSLSCHGRPVISNGNNLIPVPNETKIIAVGVGVNALIDSIENTGKFILLYLFLLFLYNNFQLKNLKLKFPNILSICFLIIFSCIYGLTVYPNVYSAIYKILLSLFLGNFIIYIIFNSYDISRNLKSLVTLSFFPLMYSDTNISFFWLFILSIVDLIVEKKIKLNKFFFISYLIISFSTISNLQNFIFTKNINWGDWILFTNHRHKGGIVDYKNGLQSLVFLYDIFVLILVFYSLFSLYKKTESLRLKFDIYNSIIIGFVIWFVSYFFSQINPTLNYFIEKLFGLPEAIDTISSYQPDGINWRGITSSWELTGVWLLIVFCILCHLIVTERKFKYFPVLIANLIAINFNTQRTVLILMIFFLIYLFLYQLREKLDLRILGIFFVLILILLQGPAGDRLQSRIQTINFDFQINEALRWEIAQSMKRYDQYELKIPKPEYDFEDVKSYQDFYSRELNTKNKFILDSFSAITKIFGRDFQWFRFFYLTNLDSKDLIYGHGAGQSHQELAVLIETPHSIYFTILFQFGIFGLFYFFSLLSFVVFQFFKSKFDFTYLVGCFIFIAGIKTEFIMTHNQLVFFIMFMTFLSFQSKNVLYK